MTFRQRQTGVAAAFDIGDGFQRRRRRGENHRRLFELRADHRHIPGVIDDAVFLLEALVVLFVDDDQAERRHRQHEGGARADRDLRRSGRRCAPDLTPLGPCQVRMPGRRADAEALLEPGEPLRSERDLRQQDDGLPALAQRRGNRLEIDLRLARAGHAFEQEGGITPADCIGQPPGRRLLIG